METLHRGCPAGPKFSIQGKTLTLGIYSISVEGGDDATTPPTDVGMVMLLKFWVTWEMSLLRVHS